jgi:hypothetical protein
VTEGASPVVAEQSHRGRRIAIWVAVGVVAILVLAQIIVPGIAAKEIRKEVGKYGVVESVSVHAFPAIELAWKAGSATVKIKTITVTPNQAVNLLEETKKINNLDMYMKSLKVNVPASTGGEASAISLEAVTVHKNGSNIAAQATIEASQLSKALPGGFEATPIANGQGKFELALKGGFLASGTQDAVVDGHDGKIVVEPSGQPNETLVVFSDKRVSVGAIHARVTPPTTTLTLSAQLR